MASIFRKHFYTKDYNDIGSIQLAYGHTPSISLEVDETDSSIVFIASCWLFLAIELKVKNKKFWEKLKWITRFQPFKYDQWLERTISLRFFDGAIWWIFWKNDSNWKSSDSKFRRGSFNFLDFILGSYNYHTVYTKESWFKVYWKNESYNVLCQVFDSTWTRSRFTFLKKKLRRYDFSSLEKTDTISDKWRYKGEIKFSLEDVPKDLTNVEHYKIIYFKNTSKPKWNDSDTQSISGFHQAKDLTDAKLLFVKWFYEQKFKYDNYEINE